MEKYRTCALVIKFMTCFFLVFRWSSTSRRCRRRRCRRRLRFALDWRPDARRRFMSHTFFCRLGRFETMLPSGLFGLHSNENWIIFRCTLWPSSLISVATKTIRSWDEIRFSHFHTKQFDAEKKCTKQEPPCRD